MVKFAVSMICWMTWALGVKTLVIQQPADIIQPVADICVTSVSDFINKYVPVSRVLRHFLKSLMDVSKCIYVKC